MSDYLKKYYDVFELKPGSSLEEIKKSRNELLRVWHPDKHQYDQVLKSRAEKKTKEINEAFAELKKFYLANDSEDFLTRQYHTSKKTSNYDSKDKSTKTSNILKKYEYHILFFITAALFLILYYIISSMLS